MTSTTAACGDDNGGGDGSATKGFTPAVSTTAPAASNAVDLVTWNLPTGEPSTLDPAQAAVEAVSTVEANLCEPLMRWTDNYQQEPALATSVDHPDATTWIFHLRPGVKFWDGTPMTAADVVFSVNRLLDPKLGSPWIGWAPQGASVTATGTDTVTVKVPAYNSTTENFFALPAFTVVSKAYAEKAGAGFGSAAGGIMCTGPYKVASWQSGQGITLTRNDAWWDSARAPKVKDIKFTFVTDPAAQTAGLVSGDMDGQFNVPVSAINQLRGSGGNLMFATSLSPLFLATLNSKGAMSDAKTREALAASVDYAGILKAIYGAAAAPLRALVPPAAWGYGKQTYQTEYDKLPEPKQDLAKAKQLAAESATKTQPIVLAYLTASAEETKVATSIADSANSIGLTVQLKPLAATEFNAVFGSAEARKGIDVLLVTGYLDAPDPVGYYQFFTQGNFYNFMGYDNAPYTEAIQKALAEPDPEKKAGYVSAAQALMAQDHLNIPLLTPYLSAFYGKKLGNFVPRSDYLYTPWAAELAGV